jgi:hypothetical protein
VANHSTGIGVDGSPWNMGDNTRGFYTDQYGTKTWVQYSSINSSEMFSDMFIGWAYNRWADDEFGHERARFMEENMPIWINQAITMGP